MKYYVERRNGQRFHIWFSHNKANAIKEAKSLIKRGFKACVVDTHRNNTIGNARYKIFVLIPTDVVDTDAYYELHHPNLK